MLNLKQRVFIDIMNQIPWGSNKMAKYNNVSSAYVKEIEADPTNPIYIEAAKKAKADYEKTFAVCDVKFDIKKNFFYVASNIIDVAYKEVEEARSWLIENGYVREFCTSKGTMKYYFYGLTAKGWKVAPIYAKLAKKESK